jgi:hypothetical protein
VGIEPSSPLRTRKLLIARFDKSYRNARNAEAKYKKGTSAMPDFCFAEAARMRRATSETTTYPGELLAALPQALVFQRKKKIT